MVFNSSIRLTRLKNGVSVITLPAPFMASIFLGVWVKTGSRYETAHQKGLSHFLEHMLFKGTEKRSAIDIAYQIDAIGANMNAYTTREVTAYHIQLLKKDFEFGCDLLSDMVQNAVLDPQEIETERQVILQEIAQTKDTPEEYVYDLLYEKIYGAESMGHPILGDENSIASFSRQDLLNYIQTHYVADNIVVVAIGGLSEENIHHTLPAYFSSIKNQSSSCFKNQTSFYSSPAITKKEYAMQYDSEQSNIVLAYPSCAYIDENYYKHSIYSLIMGGGFSSRLFQEIREKKGLAYSIYSHLAAYQDHGFLEIYTGTTHKSASQAIDLMRDLIKKTDNISHQEVDKGKNQLIAQLTMGKERASIYAEQLAFYFLHHNQLLNIDQIITRIKSISYQNIQEIASYYRDLIH